MIPPGYAGAIVDPACPLNWSYSLNYGLVADYTIIPNFGGRGVLTLRFLGRGGNSPHDGTRVNAPPWAGGKGRPGGYGSLSFNGTNQRVSSGLTAGSTFTLAAWVNLQAANAFCYVLGVSSFDDTGLRIESTATPSFADGGATGLATSPTTVALNTWHHWIGTTDGTTLTITVDGVQKATHAASVAPGIDSVNIAADSSGGASNFQKFFGDAFQIYNRVLTTAECQALYLETKSGNPNRFNWLKPRTWFVPSGGGGGTVFPESYSGSETASGSLVLAVSKALAGSSTLAGALRKAAAKPAAGSLTAAGSLAKATAKPLAGSSTGAGSQPPSHSRDQAPGPVHWPGPQRSL